MIDRYILLAEDNPNDAELTIAALKESKMVSPIVRVADGAEALDFLYRRGQYAARNEGPPALILLDLKMPKVDGLEVLTTIKKDPDLHVIPVVMLTSSREEAAVAAMKAGAQDYLMKGNMARLVAAVDRELKDAQERRGRRAAERALLAQEEEFRIAREVQQQLFPAGPPMLPGYDIAGASRPAAATGGDYFDFIPTPKGRLLVVVGDVTGHGLGPALLMAATRAYLRALVLTDQSFEDILARARQLLIEDLGFDHFITLLFAELDPAEGIWKFINAGHPTGYVFDAEGRIRAEKVSGTPALGIDRDEERLVPERIVLGKGDLVLLLTDGVTEARSAAGEEFSEERALEIVRRERAKPAAEIIQALMNEVRRFSVPDSPNQDDMTAVIVKC